MDTERGLASSRSAVVGLAAVCSVHGPVHDPATLWAMADGRVRSPVIHVLAGISLPELCRHTLGSFISFGSSDQSGLRGRSARFGFTLSFAQLGPEAGARPAPTLGLRIPFRGRGDAHACSSPEQSPRTCQRLAQPLPHPAKGPTPAWQGATPGPLAARATNPVDTTARRRASRPQPWHDSPSGVRAEHTWARKAPLHRSRCGAVNELSIECIRFVTTAQDAQGIRLRATDKVCEITAELPTVSTYKIDSPCS
jgi:hypothetical protein